MIGIVLLVVLGAIVALVRTLVTTYNKLHVLRETVTMSRSNIKIAIDRRSTAVNDLARVAQSFAGMEGRVQLQVSRDDSPVAMAAMHQQTEAYLQKVRYAVSRFPNLQSNEHYLAISHSIAELEQQIQWYRNSSNEQVARYNMMRSSFPTVLLARAMGFLPEVYIDLDVSEARQAAGAFSMEAHEPRLPDYLHAPMAMQVAAASQAAPMRSLPPAQPSITPLPSHTVLAAPVRDQAPASDGNTAYVAPLASTALRFTSGPLSGQAIEIGTSTIIGREASVSKLVVPHPQVSSAHAWIGWNGHSLVFIDRGSTNGSSVNGVPAAAGSELAVRAGDVVTLGRDGAVSFVVEQGRS